MKVILALVLAFSTSPLLSQTTIIRAISIEPNLSFENYEHYKRLILDSPDSPVEFLDGFEFEWGYTYELEVKETKLSSTLSDGTQYEFEFVRIIEKTKMPDSSVFKLYIDPKRYYAVLPGEEIENQTLKQLNDSTYSYFGKVNIVVPKHLLDKFKSIVNKGKDRSGTFKYKDKGTIRLINF